MKRSFRPTYQFFLFLWLISTTVGAQDIHFSQFYRSPLQLNPAQTGNFDGAYRFAGNLRQQWASVSKPFNSLSISADAANALRIKNLGLGLQLSNDQAGDGGLRIIQINPSASYAYKLSKDSTQHIVFGIQPSINFRQIDPSKLKFGNQYDGIKFDPILNSGESVTGNTGYFTIHTGISYRKAKDRRNQFTAGFAIHNLLNTKVSFLNENLRLVKRYTTHIEWRMPIHSKVDFTPGLQYLSQGKDNETILGTNFTYILDDRSYHFRSVQFGFWNRLKDAWVFFGGVEWDQLQVALSYDINTSSLTRASNRRGGWEISAIYIIKHRLPKRLRFRKCPDFI